MRLFLTVVFLIVCIVIFRVVSSNAAADKTEIVSGMAGYCLDDHDNSTVSGNEVDAWGCNGSGAQTWSVGYNTIKHNNECLSVYDSGVSVGNKVVLAVCKQAPGQIWLSDAGGYQNPNSGLCLSVKNMEADQAAVIANCATNQSNQQWTAQSITDGKKVNPYQCNQSLLGDRVACNASKEWTAWQSSLSGHVALLSNYTDGNAYEEWCADFVSYVYKESGAPFTQGERNGWDEYNANNLQYFNGFTYHSAANYTPKAGDIAFFDYPGGHVEIVISGGPHPTFVYGDSHIIDPATGNGDMEANTITNDGSLGQIQYYLSPTT